MNIVIFLYMLVSIQTAYAAAPGTRLWDIVNDDLKTDKTTASKVCIIDSKIDELELCEATPIITNNPTITTSGSYCLAMDITGTLIISANNVVIDLNNHIIDGGFNGISIDANRHNIKIQNGTVRGTTEQGILVNEGCQKIVLEDLLVCDCAQMPLSVSPATLPSGVAFLGSASNPIQDGTLTRLTVVNCSAGVLFELVESIRTQDCTISSCTSSSTFCVGFLTVGTTTSPSRNLLFENCFVSSMTSDLASVGIFHVDTENITLEDCVVEKSFARNGFALGIGTQDCECIVAKNCTICGIETLGFGQQAAGFLVNNTNHVHLDLCITQSISAPILALGYNFTDASHCSIKNCTAENIVANFVPEVGMGGVGGFVNTTDVLPVVEDFTYDHCYARNISSFGTSGGVNGFVALAFNNAYYTDCSVMDLRTTNTNASLFGFTLNNGTNATLNKTHVQSLIGNRPVGYFMNSLTNLNINEAISTNMLSSSFAGIARGFSFDSVQGANICNCTSTFNHAAHPTAIEAVGFRIDESSDVSLDFCKTSSNFSGNTTNNDGVGFEVTESTNIILDRCTSSYNSEDAFCLEATATSCFVGNCTASYSHRGFVDFSTTSTFYNNVASKNRVRNYLGVPFTVTQGAPTITGGNLDI